MFQYLISFFLKKTLSTTEIFDKQYKHSLFFNKKRKKRLIKKWNQEKAKRLNLCTSQEKRVLNCSHFAF